jgi:hypothetical protein
MEDIDRLLDNYKGPVHPSSLRTRPRRVRAVGGAGVEPKIKGLDGHLTLEANA